LYRETAERDKISIHSFDYYKTLFSLASTYTGAPTVRLLLAEIDETVTAGIIIAFHGAGATYLYGASSDYKRNYMPNYALQWRAIESAKDHGCLWYDLFGIPPVGDPEQPMYGLYRFKVGFGGRVIHRPGCWDIPIRGRMYNAYRFAERARTYYYKTLKKR
jgi:lipid II:glycine glycyltransferase (peptidoglycan interpeptide bridge formation enzyme)